MLSLQNRFSTNYISDKGQIFEHYANREVFERCNFCHTIFMTTFQIKNNLCHVIVGSLLPVQQKCN